MSGLNWALWGLLAAVVLAGGGCGTTGQAPQGTGCMPPAFALSPATAAPGGSITVSAQDATCNPRYGDTAQIQLEITDSAGTLVLEELAPMNDAGGFSAVLTIPGTAVPGTGTVVAYPYNLDWCDDTGRNNRIDFQDGAEGPVLQRVSCVMPTRPLTIAP